MDIGCDSLQNFRDQTVELGLIVEEVMDNPTDRRTILVQYSFRLSVEPMPEPIMERGWAACQGRASTTELLMGRFHSEADGATVSYQYALKKHDQVQVGLRVTPDTAQCVRSRRSLM